jgi:hypothetical protein
MGAELKLTVNNDSDFLQRQKKGVTLEMVLLVCIMIAEVDSMAFISIEREEPSISQS